MKRILILVAFIIFNSVIFAQNKKYDFTDKYVEGMARVAKEAIGMEMSIMVANGDLLILMA